MQGKYLSCKSQSTNYIDSKVLAQAEAKEELVETVTETDDAAEDKDILERKLTKAEQAELLRRTVDTVGRVGQPGEKIRSVISVGMLSEG